MLWMIAVILIVLWVLGLVTSYTMGGFIHILLVIAVIVVLVNIIRDAELCSLQEVINPYRVTTERTDKKQNVSTTRSLL